VFLEVLAESKHHKEEDLKVKVTKSTSRTPPELQQTSTFFAFKKVQPIPIHTSFSRHSETKT